MKYVLIILTLIIGGAVLAASGDSSTEPAPLNSTQQEQAFSLQEIESQLALGEAHLLDVRSKAEFDFEHATPAELFNVEWLQAGQLPDIPTDEALYVYCRSGNRSAVAAGILRQAGYTVYDLGAFENWKDLGGDTISS